MKRNRFFLLVALLALALALAACEAAPEPEPTATSVPEAATAAPTNTPPPDPTATAEATETAQPAPTDTPQAETAVAITLERRTNETMGLSVLVPEEWNEVAPGAYARAQSAADLTTLIQQAAPGTTAGDLANALLPQLGIDALPEPVEALQTEGFAWDIYQIEVEAPPAGAVAIDLALAESDAAAYLVLLQTTPADYEPLHQQVFLPAVQGLELLEAEEEGAVYEDPAGFFSVPVPTNWDVSQQEEYVTLLGPEEQLQVHILSLATESLSPEDEEAITQAAIDQAWQIVDPDFDREVADTAEAPGSAAQGVDEFVLITYEEGEEEDDPIVQVEGRRYQDRVYVLIFVLDLEAYQQRAAQIQIIDTGFEIVGLEEADLSGVEPLPLSDEVVAELEAFIKEQMAALETPGMAISVVRDGEIVYAEGFGVRDLESEEPVTPQTLMMIGSTTKPLTTMLMAGLVDDGAFTWDTPAAEILPTFEVSDPDLSGALTMRNLVCACTGVPRRDFELLFNAGEMDAADVIDSVSEFEFFTDFGEAFQYSNQMVATGGYLATLAAGGDVETLLPDYVALLQTEILDPMAMDASTFDFEAVAAGDNYAHPYGQTLMAEMIELPLSTEALLLPIAPAGALWSNVLDMANFARTSLNQGVAPDGGRVVSAENLAVTWEPQIEISADASYGLGWIIEDYKGLQVISHAGNTFGFTSELAFIPEADLGISILTNQQGSALNGIVRARLLELLYEQESEVDELVAFALQRGEEAKQELAEALVEIDDTAVSPYLGAYQNESLGALSLAWEEETLLMDAGEFQAEVRARETEEGEIVYFIFTPPFAGMQLDLREDEAGRPLIDFGLGAMEYTFEKVE